MNRVLMLLCVIFFLQEIKAQDFENKDIDSLYREDQFFIGVTYNILGNRPDALSQNGFSSGFHLGFIRDMPINKDRNIAIGLGFGYSTNSFNQNLLVSKDDQGMTSLDIIDDSNTYSKNKFSNHIIEFPLEFRWRTSTATDYNFWRVYTGFKLSYIFAYRTKYKGDLGNLIFNDIDVLNKLQYGLTLSAGYNTWNLYLYYALNPIFSDTIKLNGNDLNMNAIKVGLMFYIL